MIVERYISSDGKSPFEDWFNKLEPKTRARVRAKIKRIEFTDNLGEYKRLGQINELKFSFGGGIRVYFGMKGKTFVLLLCGGNKKRQSSDIAKPLNTGRITMSKRSEKWDKDLSQSLIENEEERKEYFLALIEEGFDWREALKITVESIGLKEYAQMTGIKPPNLLSQLSSDKDIRLSTLEKMVKPLNVSLSFTEFEQSAS